MANSPYSAIQIFAEWAHRGLAIDLYDEHGDEIAAVAAEMKPCEYCETQHYKEFILRELMNRAVTDFSEDSELDTLLN